MNSLKEMLENDERFAKNKVSDEELQAWREKVEREDQERVRQALFNNRARIYKRDSVWGTSGEQTFTFQKWNPKVQPNQKLAHDIWKKSADITKRMFDSNFNVLFYGEAGTGKTAMVLAIIDALKQHSDKLSMFVSVMDLRELIMYDFNDNEAAIKIKNIERSMREVDVLILDDFGSEAGGMKNEGSATERLQQFWFRVAEARQVRDKDGNKRYSTIVTTNNDRGDLERMYNKKIVSRLITKKAENTVVFDGLDDVRE
ncbi:DnaA ATPase domain-containing protein [Leuconostoc mesenteroides]|uniref:DnaA ATPase domain-containing protein n=1 Tax=Leuconostoc mesenteroides TaxID=1245 RepID=UPI001CBD9F3C|nr:AAA family ATPase [Leuconostoc mesenteroides]MBZ1502935.1 ATP-binding protein [Leuconostoc mesenteroides]